jgi:sulfur relay (sulfurtransferase) DsrC/TusE family protein
VSELTIQQRRVLNYIRRFWRRYHFSPTLRDIAKAFKWSGPHAAVCHLKRLLAKGAVTYGQAGRTIVVVGEEYGTLAGRQVDHGTR